MIQKNKKHLIVIFIWSPFLLAAVIVISIAVLFRSSQNYASKFDLSKFESVLNITFPQTPSNVFSCKAHLKRTWNPFLGKKENIVTLKSVAKRRLHLSAVLDFPGGKACVLNGRFYKQSDTVYGAKILRITGRAVYLLLPNGKKVVLYVGEEILY